MEQGHRGHDLSPAPDKRPVWTNLGLGQGQTLVPDQLGTHTPSCITYAFRQISKKAQSLPSTHLYLPHFTSSLGSFVSICVCPQTVQIRCSCTECPILLSTVRSSSVCQDVGSANSTVICMFPWYIVNWLSNQNPLTRTGKSCNGTCRMKSICFTVKKKRSATGQFASTVGRRCGSSTLCLTRTNGASGWPRWCCTCSNEKRSPPENLRVQTCPPPYPRVHHSLTHYS